MSIKKRYHIFAMLLCFFTLISINAAEEKVKIASKPAEKSKWSFLGNIGDFLTGMFTNDVNGALKKHRNKGDIKAALRKHYSRVNIETTSELRKRR